MIADLLCFRDNYIFPVILSEKVHLGRTVVFDLGEILEELVFFHGLFGSASYDGVHGVFEV